jgi:cell division protein FtsB
MRILALVFAALIVALQYPMWLGRGGWLQVRELGRQVERQQGVNVGLKERNDALEAEVHDLKQGFDAVEERARSELGMVRRDEIFFMLQERRTAVGEPAAGAAPTRGPGAASEPAVRPGPGAVPAPASAKSMADGTGAR